MDRDQYLALMAFPKEWLELDMFPDELWSMLRGSYRQGHEQSPEHDRNGVFHWWLRKSPDRDVLLKLVTLSLLDPDQVMAADVQNYIKGSKNADSDVCAEIEKAQRLQ